MKITLIRIITLVACVGMILVLGLVADYILRFKAPIIQEVKAPEKKEIAQIIQNEESQTGFSSSSNANAFQEGTTFWPGDRLVYAPVPYIIPGENFVLVDLGKMEVEFIDRENKVIHQWPILSIRPSGKFATPTGNFKALMKEEKHFSSIGKVWMPWSVQFEGNYFIHGWPYYPGGEPVPEGYSGGCVRLATEDMEKLYEFIKVGMPIIVVK